MHTMNGHVISSGPSELARFAFLIQALTDEIIEELEDKDDERIGAMMQVMGEVLAWIGHGDDERLPELVRGFAEGREPEPIAVEA
jgi:predicted house-cleaning noncanonical NTP pyrophosphatase (MazG superfamily)